MIVGMVDIGVVHMVMRQPGMGVFMRVGFYPAPREIVRVLMMLIVRMPMTVSLPFVRVLMHVPFRQVQPDAGGHQDGGDPETRCGDLVQQP